MGNSRFTATTTRLRVGIWYVAIAQSLDLVLTREIAVLVLVDLFSQVGVHLDLNDYPIQPRS